MGDVANILGIKTSNDRTTPVPSFHASTNNNNNNNNNNHAKTKGTRLTGIQKEVMNLLGASTTTDLPPIMPSKKSAALASTTPSRNLGSAGMTKTAQEGIKKGIASMKKRPAKKWIWAPFQSSARSDKVEFCHWVKADVEYPDYPYARFDVHLDPVVYNDDEYERYLKDEPSWTKNDTDKLMEMARIFELRWPVIYDRFNAHMDEFASTSTVMIVRSTEELQYRYYFISTRLTKVRMELAAASQVQANGAVGASSNSISSAMLDSVNKIIPSVTLGTGSSTVEFNLDQERTRRKYLEIQWNRPKIEEREESQLRIELKRIETQIRKLKKSGKHLLESSSADSRSSKGVGPNELNKYFVPSSFSIGAPYLQSDRLHTPTNADSIINKTLLKKMELVIKELNVPDRMIPTKRSCDMYDNLRKSVLTLLTLQKLALKKEAEVASKRKRLSREYPGSLEAIKGTIGILDKAAAAVAMANKPPSSSGTTSTKKNSTLSIKNKNSKTIPKNSKSLEAMVSSNKKSNKRKSVKRATSNAENKVAQNLSVPSSAPPQPLPITTPSSEDSKSNKKRVRKT